MKEGFFAGVITGKWSQVPADRGPWPEEASAGSGGGCPRSACRRGRQLTSGKLRRCRAGAGAERVVMTAEREDTPVSPFSPSRSVRANCENATAPLNPRCAWGREPRQHLEVKPPQLLGVPTALFPWHRHIALSTVTGGTGARERPQSTRGFHRDFPKCLLGRRHPEGC